MQTTIITISKNSAKTLERTVLSVLAQSVLPQEYIFVDGHSTDATPPLLVEMKKKLEMNRVPTTILSQIHKAGNAGIPEAWNQGISAATGDVIAILNSDDAYEPYAIHDAQELFRQDPDAEIAVLPIRWVDAAGNSQGIFKPAPLNRLYWRMAVPHPGCFVKASVYRRIGLYNTKYSLSADYEFLWRCKMAGVRFVYGKTPAVNMETGGAANSHRSVARNETLAIASKYTKFPVLPLAAWLTRFLLRR